MDKRIDEQHILQYLEGTLRPDEQHRLEAVMDQDPFLRDAVEGLSGMPDKQRVYQIVLQINKHLRKHSAIKRKRMLPFIEQKLLLWASVLILFLLVLLAWWVLKTKLG